MVEDDKAWDTIDSSTLAFTSHFPVTMTENALFYGNPWAWEHLHRWFASCARTGKDTAHGPAVLLFHDSPFIIRTPPYLSDEEVEDDLAVNWGLRFYERYLKHHCEVYRPFPFLQQAQTEFDLRLAFAFDPTVVYVREGIASRRG